MALIKIDGFDIYSYTRIAPGEGMDFADQDFLDPQFGDSPVGAGDPLLSVKENNREISFPVHLRGTSALKDSLHAVVSDVYRRCSNAKILEWKDDGATNSSFLDIEFARFEPEFNKRRQDAGWMSGVIRLFTKPYARSVSSGYGKTWVASAPVTGIMGSVGIASYGGDAPGEFQFNLTTPSVWQNHRDGRITGAALLPPSYVADWAAASLVLLNGATLVGWSDAAGSQVVAQHAFATVTRFIGRTKSDMARLFITNASAYSGRNRVLLVAASDRFNAGFYMRDDAGRKMRTGLATVLGELNGFGTVDLGVVNIDPRAGATKVLTFSYEENLDEFEYEVFKGSASQGYNAYRINRVVLLPEDTTILTLDANRTPLAAISNIATLRTYYNAASVFIIGRPPLLDDYGNGYGSIALSQYATSTLQLQFDPNNGGAPMLVPVGTVSSIDISAAAVINTPTTVDLSGQAFGALYPGQPSNALVFGKYVGGGSPGIYGVRLNTETGVGTAPVRSPTYYYLQIIAGLPGLQSISSVSAVACTTIPAGAVDGYTNDTAPLWVKFAQKGPTIEVVVQAGNVPTAIATLSASVADADRPGIPFLGMRVPYFSDYGWTGRALSFANQPSAGHLAGDQYTFDSEGHVITRGINAKFSLSPRGPFPRRTDPSKYTTAVVFNLPLDGGSVNQPWSFGVSENEYFTYAVK